MLLLSLFSISVHLKPGLQYPRIRDHQSWYPGRQSSFAVLKKTVGYSSHSYSPLHLEGDPFFKKEEGGRPHFTLHCPRHGLRTRHSRCLQPPNQTPAQSTECLNHLPGHLRREPTGTFKKELYKGGCRRDLSTEKVSRP